MKVLLFTHEQDIDGMGCVVLAKRAFNNLDYELCKTFEITNKVKKYIDDKTIYNYDAIYVTDLCIKEPVLKYIDEDIELRNKLIVLDHHKSEIEEGNDKYSFVNIIVEKDGRKVSGTWLFYDYLVSNKFLEASSVLDEIVEWTRQYDVWDWKKINNYEARKLHILFEVLGYKKYLEITDRIIDNEDRVIFNEEENAIVDKFNKDFERDISEILSNMKVVDINVNDVTYKVGYVKCLYKYRNDINEEVMKDNKYDVDMVGMIMTDIDTVSYRTVKDVDVSKVAVHFGGKGHKPAGSNPQDNEKFKYILEMFK